MKDPLILWNYFVTLYVFSNGEEEGGLPGPSEEDLELPCSISSGQFVSCWNKTLGFIN